MNFKKADSSKANGTSLQGYLYVPYSRLVEVLGEPHILGGDKVQAEWILEFGDGTIATIYDYKEHVGPRRVTEWHIGGRNKKAEALVNALFASAPRLKE